MVKGVEMDEHVILDIIDVLDHVKDALERLDIDDLSDWSNHVLNSIAIYQEKRAVYVTMIAYSLSKLVEKNKGKHVTKQKWNNFIVNMLKDLVRASEAIEKRKFAKFDSLVTIMLKRISEFDNAFTHYVEKVLDFSKIQKGAKIYEHGISLSTVAKMLSISKWKLMRKVGELKEKPKEAKLLGGPKTPRHRLMELRKLSKKSD